MVHESVAISVTVIERLSVLKHCVQAAVRKLVFFNYSILFPEVVSTTKQETSQLNEYSVVMTWVKQLT